MIRHGLERDRLVLPPRDDPAPTGRFLKGVETLSARIVVGTIRIVSGVYLITALQ